MWSELRDRWRPQPLVSANPGEQAAGTDRPTSLLAVVAIAVGSAALALGALWVWQTWSQRSAVPIDDQLPLLLETSLPVAPSDGGDRQEASGAEPAVAAPREPPPTPAVGGAVETVVVHVSGAVHAPGVVEADASARVFDAVTLAGGATERADLDRINLAAPLVDGERIHVLAIGEVAVPPVVAPDRSSSLDTGASGLEAEPGGAVLDINTATISQLETLPGVGPATARSIVGLREDRGPFLSVEELLDVAGIGTAKLALLRPYVVAGPG